MDVSDSTSIAEAASRISDDLGPGGLDLLVNNAGIGGVVPMEYVTPSELQHIFGVNVFGLVATTQAFLTALRSGRGRVINISSVGALATVPFGGPLCATKRAVEALSEALRMELADCGIEVILIRPGSIHTPAAGTLPERLESMLASLPAEGRSRYEAKLRAFLEKVLANENSGTPPEEVAEVIAEAATAAHPKTSYLVGKNSHILAFLGQFVPKAAEEKLILSQLGLSSSDPS